MTIKSNLILQGNSSVDSTIYWTQIALDIIEDSHGVKAYYHVIQIPVLTFYKRACQPFLDKTDPGILLNRFSQDMTLVETPLSIGALFMVYS